MFRHFLAGFYHDQPGKGLGEAGVLWHLAGAIVRYHFCSGGPKAELG
jgi:hypothetical protein